MKFSHKILLAAALVVAVAFACFILFNDYRQREALRSSTEASMQELGSLTTSNIQTWLESRIQLLQSLAQQVAADGISVLCRTSRPENERGFINTDRLFA